MDKIYLYDALWDLTPSRRNEADQKLKRYATMPHQMLKSPVPWISLLLASPYNKPVLSSQCLGSSGPVGAAAQLRTVRLVV
jgi:hypothetical protein